MVTMWWLIRIHPPTCEGKKRRFCSYLWLVFGRWHFNFLQGVKSPGSSSCGDVTICFHQFRHMEAVSVLDEQIRTDE